LTSLAATTESGYYEVRWEDIINIDVNKTRAKLTWTYNGTCVTSSTGSGYWWWQTATGWHLDDPGSYAWKTTSNCSAFTHANGHHWNSSFCFPLPITDTYAKDVRFRGGYKGGIGAYVGSVYKNDDCFPLHWADTLKRT
jgi:hypothetical protein